MIPLTITDVRAHPGDSAFLIDNGKTAILYDSGFAFTGFAVANKIKEQLGERELDYIFLTHSHYDHALGAAYALQYWPHAKVVAGEYAVKIFQKDSARSVMRDLDRKFATRCGVAEYPDHIDDLRVDIPVREGDQISAGEMLFTVVEMPGHTRCSVAYYLAENQLLLSSETLGVFDGEETVFPSYLVGYQMTLDSIAKAERLPIKNILLPHYGLLNEGETSRYLRLARKSAVETAREIREIYKKGGSLQDAAHHFKEKFYHGRVVKIYPKDAMKLNTSIMVKLLAKEFGFSAEK